MLDNSATCHICNDKDMFIGNITPIPKDSQLGVETAGEQPSQLVSDLLGLAFVTMIEKFMLKR